MANRLWKFICVTGNTIIVIFGIAFITAFVYGVYAEMRNVGVTEPVPELYDKYVSGPETIKRIEYPEDKIVCYYTEKWGQCFWSNLN